jgi:hypothetical protein
MGSLEHFQKYCSHAVGKDGKAVFLGLGFVSAQSQAAAGMLLRQSLAQTPKILAPHGYSISSKALGCYIFVPNQFPVNLLGLEHSFRSRDPTWWQTWRNADAKNTKLVENGILCASLRALRLCVCFPAAAFQFWEATGPSTRGVK